MTLTCLTSPGKSPTDYAWSKGDGRIGGETGTTLEIRADLQKPGSFQCRASEDGGGTFDLSSPYFTPSGSSAVFLYYC